MDQFDEKAREIVDQHIDADWTCDGMRSERLIECAKKDAAYHIAAALREAAKETARGRIASRLHSILDKLCGDAEDWIEAIEAIGVRPAYYDGSHRAYLGKDKPCWTNATVARFSTAEEAQEWCERANKELYQAEV